jgi:2,3,4,5-tetrahydropyridine-2-carboxylate N-succinyltransferase
VLVGGNCGVYEGTLVRARAVLGAGTILTRSTPLYDLVRGEIYRATLDTPLEVPENAVVVPGSRAVSSREVSSSSVRSRAAEPRTVEKGTADEWGLSLYTPVIVKYRDQKTDRGIELEDWLR